MLSMVIRIMISLIMIQGLEKFASLRAQSLEEKFSECACMKSLCEAYRWIYFLCVFQGEISSFRVLPQIFTLCLINVDRNHRGETDYKEQWLKWFKKIWFRSKLVIDINENDVHLETDLKKGSKIWANESSLFGKWCMILCNLIHVFAVIYFKDTFDTTARIIRTVRKFLSPQHVQLIEIWHSIIRLRREKMMLYM